jgi:hypothetical protein
MYETWINLLNKMRCRDLNSWSLDYQDSDIILKNQLFNLLA